MGAEIQLDDLPQDWQMAHLGDHLIRLANGLTAKQEQEPPGLAVSRIETISDGIINFEKVRYVRELDEDKQTKFLLKKGDILFSHINSDRHLGKTAIYMADRPLLHGMNLLVMRPNAETLDSKFLHYYLNLYRALGKFIEVAQHAVNQSSLNQTKVNAVPVPLPPIDTQKRIVTEIEKQLSRLDEAVASLNRAKANLKRYKAAVLKAAVEGKLVKTEREFERLEMRDLGQLHCGQSPTSKDVNTEGDGTLYVTGPEQWDGHSVHESKWTTDPRRVVPYGCIFITVKGSGVGTLFPGIACAIGRDVYAFQPNDRCLSGYVELALQASINDVLRHASGDIPGLSKKHILDHEIGVPSLDTQKEILMKVDEVLSLEKVAANSVENDLRRLERLRQSVLAKAFIGKLRDV